MSIQKTYKALGDKDYSITLFADAFKSGETTITELFAMERPSNNGQALALFGGYARAQFGMELEAIAGYVDTFSGDTQAVYQLMIESNSLEAVVVGLNRIGVELTAKSDENRAKRIASGTAHKTAINALITQAENIRNYGVVNGDNLAKLGEAVSMLEKLYTESLSNSKELQNA
jgi:hypothetical protein